jgi:Uma2 family endonuclease
MYENRPLIELTESELIDGRLVRKMSPKRRHQKLELRWVAALQSWAGDDGEALTEWRFAFQAPGFTFGSLQPDVAYLSRAALDELGPAGSEKPKRAPEIVVEIISAGDREPDLAWKVRAYLAAGTWVVFIVDPPKRTVIAHSPAGTAHFGPGRSSPMRRCRASPSRSMRCSRASTSARARVRVCSAARR